MLDWGAIQQTRIGERKSDIKKKKEKEREREREREREKERVRESGRERESSKSKINKKISHCDLGCKFSTHLSDFERKHNC